MKHEAGQDLLAVTITAYWSGKPASRMQPAKGMAVKSVEFVKQGAEVSHKVGSPWLRAFHST